MLYEVITRGHTTVAAIEAQFGTALAGAVEGDAEYDAAIRFPNGQSEAPGPLQITVQSDRNNFV